MIAEALARIEGVDERAARVIAEGLAPVSDCFSDALVSAVADVVVWALIEEPSFGEATADGAATLLRRADTMAIKTYVHQVRQAGARGPALGRLMAEFLVPVLTQADPVLTDLFIKTAWSLHQVGIHALTKPLPTVSALLADGDGVAAATYLEMLGRAFAQQLTYQQSLRFCRSVPRAVLDFDRRSRRWQTQALRQVAGTEFQMIDAFLEGMPAGLGLLAQKVLERFVETALDIWRQNRRRGIEFLALRSREAIDWLAAHQTTAVLAQIRPALLRYVQARTGRAVNIYPLERLPASARGETFAADPVYCDGVNLYLPSQISTAATLAKNEALYWYLARLECGTIEFDSFGFDLKKLCQKYPRLARWRDRAATASRGSDLQQFLATFPNPDFASDLYTIYEHGRLRLLTLKHYPGLSRRLALALNKLEGSWAKGRGSDDLRSQLYRTIALGKDQWQVPDLVTHLYRRFEAHISDQATAEDSGALVADTYASVAAELRTQGMSIDHLPPMPTPYGRRIDADLHAAVHGDRVALARKITDLLTRAGINCYCSDVQCTLQLAGPERLIDGLLITGKDNPGQNGTAPVVDAATADALRQLITAHGHRFECRAEAAGADTVWYPEWDHHLNGYLHCHTAVRERSLKGRDESLATRAQQRHAGLIRATRYAFEMMRPQGLAILRQWIEGDDFDYRALMDYAVERKAGHNPSERVYIKRLKNERSVAVLLLVDLSRSTANIAADGRQSVINVEKEAIYIFCCALSILGDEFGVAGFSGNGRLQVDYSVLKDFKEDFGPSVIARIGAVAPQRNTRMGAAIRHATAQLCQRPAKVPLLIILGDGFPNDVDYKQGYALADTRKALAEACAKGVFTHGITVNMAADPKLDDLYGDSLHTVISDVRELPNKLVRIYSALTRR